MVNSNDRIKLYTQQRLPVIERIQNEGTCFSKKEYIDKKYGESSIVFSSAYSWFAKEAQKIVPAPEGAEYPYWCFKDPVSIEKSDDSRVLVLEVPVDEVILFRMYEWNKILKLQFIGQTEQEEIEFRKQLRAMGISHDSEAVVSTFYPELKSKIEKSWFTLFRFNVAYKENYQLENEEPIQGSLWQIKKEWIIDILA